MKKEDFDRLKEQLTYGRSRKVVAEDIIEDPVFLVQKRVRDYDVPEDIADSTVVLDHESEGGWSDCTDFYSDLDEDEQATLDALSFGYMSEDEKLEVIRRNLDYTSVHIVSYKNRWIYVSAHFTLEAAELYKRQMKHVHGEMRVFVDSAFRCWDFNDLLDGIISGKVVYKEDV